MLASRVKRAFNAGLAISTITLAELRVGGSRADDDPENVRRLDMFVATLRIHAFDEAAANAYGLLVRRVGIRRQSFDRLIAAHAGVLNLTLVTNTVADFADVPGLRVENWSKPE